MLFIYMQLVVFKAAVQNTGHLRTLLLFDIWIRLHQWNSFVMLDDIQRDELLVSILEKCALKG